MVLFYIFHADNPSAWFQPAHHGENIYNDLLIYLKKKEKYIINKILELYT